MTSTNVPGPFDIYWNVRNGGTEAPHVGQLRGEIIKDDGQRARTETTSYKGTHYVECFVVKDGTVVTKDRQRVIVTKELHVLHWEAGWPKTKSMDQVKHSLDWWAYGGYAEVMRHTGWNLAKARREVN